jgi:predicted enzyme related to lactoylglutathione lyase
MKHAIDWFQIPTTDFERAIYFYQTILSAELQVNDMNGMKMAVLPHNREEHGVGGALYHGPGHEPSGTGTIVFLHGGDDLSVILSRIEDAGGKIVVPKTPIGQNGFVASFLDTEGNKVGIHSIH